MYTMIIRVHRDESQAEHGLAQGLLSKGVPALRLRSYKSDPHSDGDENCYSQSSLMR